MTDRSGPETARGPGDGTRTRDWVWGLLAAVVVGILVPLVLVWLLIGSAQCGTRPAEGDGNPALATSCGGPR